MKAAAFVGVKDIRVVDIAMPAAGRDGVVVRMRACGVCGTDMHVYNAGLFIEASTRTIEGHAIIGHEFAGDIVEAGPDAQAAGWRIGDRVLSTHNKGGMAEYVQIPSERLKDLYRIPDGVSYAAAATVEALCNPVHSFHLREPQDSDTVAIFGCGAIGLGYLQVVKARSGARTIASDVSPLRLETARRLGADAVVNARETDAVAEIKRLTGERPMRYVKGTAGGVDIAVECAGKRITLQGAIDVVKPMGATVVVAAAYEEILPLDPNLVMFKYMTIYGSMGYSDAETGEAVELVGSGRADRDSLVSHRIPLAQAADAFAVQADVFRSIKVVVVSE